MGDRSFQMRLRCRYEEPNNAPADPRVENLENGEWRTFDLGLRAPGFLIFVYAIFNCQHLYLRTNAAERALVMEAASGFIDVLAAEDWSLRTLAVRFQVQLRSGKPTAEDVAYILERMKQCPVSRNVVEVSDSSTVVDFEPKR
jgi:hypothetical protein